MKPLVCPIPFRGESPGSVLLRASELNGWSRAGAMLSAYTGFRNYAPHRSSVLFTDTVRLRKVCGILGIPSEQVESLAYPRCGFTKRSPLKFMGLEIPERFLRLKNPAVCPQCIEESGHVPSLWDCRLMTACPTHRLALIDRCPACDQSLTWNRKNLASCGCGLALAEWPRRAESTRSGLALVAIFESKYQHQLDAAIAMFDALKLTFKMASLLSDQAAEVPDYAGLVDLVFDKRRQLKEISKIVDRLAVLGFHPRIALIGLLASNRSEISEVGTALLDERKSPDSTTADIVDTDVGLVHAARILGISAWLTIQLIRAGVLAAKRPSERGRYSVSVQSINELLGLQSRGRDLPGPTITISEYLNQPSVDEQFSDVLKTLISGERVHVSSSPSEGLLSLRIVPKEITTRERSQMTISEVAEMCGCNYENIRFAVHAGVLRRTDPSTCRGTMIRVSRENGKRFHETYVFGGVVARQFGMNPTNFAEKIKTQGVNPVSGPGIDGGLTYLFLRRDIESLDMREVVSVTEYPTKTGRKKGGTKRPRRLGRISISQAASMLGVPFQAIERLIKRGVLTLVPTSGREKHVSRKSLQKVLDVLADPKYIPLQLAASAVDESTEQFRRRWIQTSFVELVDVGVKALVSSLDLKRVEEFKKRYISSADAARKWNILRSHLTNLEKQTLLEPAKVFSEGHSTVKFYLRTDVDRLLGSSPVR